MPKRKQERAEADSDDESDSKKSIVDVDFDFCDFKPATDYVAMKRLLQQLFHTDASMFDLGGIADLILSQDDVGCTVKTDGPDSDPLGFLAVVNMNHHHTNPALSSMRDYILSKISTEREFHQLVTKLLAQPEHSSHLGLIIGERVYNMPPQVMPPSYKMLENEIEWALEDGKPYRFSHYLILSRVWRSSPEDEHEGDPTPKRRKTSSTLPSQSKISKHSFHPEDECIQKLATFSLDFNFSQQDMQPRSGDSFGTDIAGRIMLLPAAKLQELAHEMAILFPPPA